MTTLSVSLENANEPLLAGQTLKGCVVLHVMKGLSGQGIETVLKGEENTAVSHSTGTGKDRRKHTVHRSECFLQVPIAHDEPDLENGKINPGYYQLPFEVEIPDTVPSSMKENGIEYCGIKYFVATRVLGSGVIYDYSATAEFQVIARVAIMAVAPVIAGPASEKVNVCCCLNRGHATIGARLDDSILGKSESIQVFIAARNNSTVPIVRAKAELREHIRWHAGPHSESRFRSLEVTEFPLLPGLEKKRPGEKVGTLMEAEVDLQKEIRNGGHSILISVPKFAKDTYKGQLLECLHELRICLETESCVTSPTLVIPLQIVPWTRKK